MNGETVENGKDILQDGDMATCLTLKNVDCQSYAQVFTPISYMFILYHSYGPFCKKARYDLAKLFIKLIFRFCQRQGEHE